MNFMLPITKVLPVPTVMLLNMILFRIPDNSEWKVNTTVSTVMETMKSMPSINFEEIEKEFQQSTHFNANRDAFTCWKCHNPHSYKISIRDSKNITQSIAYDNQICLNCHSDFERFQLLTDRKEINLIQKHEWLPNQALHFSQVRCIECHARPNDSLLVAHLHHAKGKSSKAMCGMPFAKFPADEFTV